MHSFYMYFFYFSLSVRCISDLSKKLFLFEPDFMHYNLFSGLALEDLSQGSKWLHTFSNNLCTYLFTSLSGRAFV